MEDKIQFKEYYWNNGILTSKQQFLNGEYHGEQIGYFINGELSYKHQYLNGKLHGEQLGYQVDGQISYKYYYFNGKEVSEEEWNKINEVNSPHFNLL